MPNYPGKRKGTRRIVIWAKLTGELKSRPREWVISGTKPEGDAFEARKRVELLQQRPAEFRTAPPFYEFCAERYRPYAEANLKGTSWRNTRQYEVATLVVKVGHVKLSEFSKETIETLKVELRRQMGPVATNTHLRVLRMILNYALELGIAVPQLKWRYLPITGRNVLAWTDAEVQALFRAARRKSPGIVEMLVFLLNTGCRKGEAIAAEQAWVDWPARMLRLPGDKVKNRKPRAIPVGGSLETVLRRASKGPRWLFPRRDGERYVKFPHEQFWAARDAAKLRGGIHTTRHTFASHFLRAQPDLFLLAQVMGHSHQRVTEMYSHLLPDHLARARGVVDLSPDHGPNRGTNVVTMRNYKG